MRTQALLLTTALLLTACLAQAQSTRPAVDYTWRNVPILGGGFVSGLVFHPTEPRLLYARTDIGGLYRWEESARRWVPLTDHFGAPDWTYTGIESVALDPTDPNRVYAAVGTYTNSWSGPGAMLRSVNRGATWQLTPLPFKNGANEGGRNNGERLAVDPRNPARLLFGSRHNGLWTSTDHGATWSPVDSFPVKTKIDGPGVGFVVFDPHSPTIYVAVQSKSAPLLYRSTDAGATWAPLDNPLSRNLLPQHAKLTPDGQTLYVTYANHEGPNGMGDGALLRYDVAADTWIDLSPIKRQPGDGFGFSGISLDPRNPATLVVSTNNRWSMKDEIFRSTDAGKTWTPLIKGAEFVSDARYALKHSPHWTTDVEIDPLDPDRVWFVTGYGVWATRNASAPDRNQRVRWSFDNHGLEECVILDLLSPPAGNALLFSSMYDQDAFRHTSLDTPPADRIEPYRGGSNDLDVAWLNPSILARQHQGKPRGSISLDGGATWSFFPASPATPSNGDKVAGLSLSADGATLLWAMSDDVPYRSTDRGITWTPVAGLPPKSRVFPDRADPRRFYAYDPETRSLFTSTDAGTTFSNASVLPSSLGTLRALPHQPGHLLAVLGNRLHLSTDAGATVTPLPLAPNTPTTTAPADAALPDFRVMTFGLGAPAPGTDTPTLFANGHLAGVYGLYRSTDLGRTWLRINDDLHQFAHLHVIEGDPRTFARVYLGSGSRGVLVGEPRP